MPKTNPLPILPQPWQLPALASGEASLIVVPMFPQPELTTDNCWVWESYPIDLIWFANETPGIRVLNKCPYRPMAEIYVQEEWADEFMEGVGLVSRCKSWVESALKPSEISFVEWLRPSIMPIEAARIWLKVASIACVQFGQLTGDDERAMGWRNEAPMPAFCSDDDWVWAVGVKAIAPSFT